MAATATPEIAMESIIPLLRIARKIEKCNASQLSAVAKQLISIFDIKMTFPIPNGHDGSMYEIQPESLVKSSNDLDALTNEILRFVCHNHHKFTNLQFETIESILPHDLQLDDSIAKSTEYHLKPLTLIKLPTAISIKICKYLLHKDHIHLQLTSRSLCTIARNPNACHVLDVSLHRNKQFETRICFQERYSRIRTFRIWFTSNAVAVHAPLRWGNTINCLCIVGQSLLFDAEMYFKHLHSLNCTSVDHPHACALIGSHVNHHCLVVLHLCDFKMNNTMCEALCKCIHLTRLTLVNVRYNTEDAEAINNNPLFDWMHQSPLNELENICIDWSLNQIANFIHFILNGKFAAKRLNIESDAYSCMTQDEMKLFSSESPMGVNALQKIKYLNISVFVSFHSNDHLIFNNMLQSIRKKPFMFDHLSVDMTIEDAENNNTYNGFDWSIVQYCKSSDLTIYLSLVADDPGNITPMDRYVQLINDVCYPGSCGTFNHFNVDILVVNSGQHKLMPIYNKYVDWLTDFMTKDILETIGMDSFALRMEIPDVLPMYHAAIENHVSNKCMVKRYDDGSHSDLGIAFTCAMHEKEWIGEYIKKTENGTYYNGIRIHGVEYSIGSDVFVINDSGNDWLAKIVELFEDGEGCCCMNNMWFWRHSEIAQSLKIKPFDAWRLGAKEVFLSTGHEPDTNPVELITQYKEFKVFDTEKEMQSYEEMGTREAYYCEYQFDLKQHKLIAKANKEY
eukprot:139028_1